MDRLQQAISKARNERDERAVEPAQPMRTSKARVETKEPRPRPRISNDVDSRWAEFDPLLLPSRTIMNNRLEAHGGGESAIPYDMLRTKILQQMRKNDWKRLAIVSPESGVGKSTISANLGLSFSRMREKRTIILDFDLRRVGLAKMLGQKMKQSMSGVLEGRVPFGEHGLCFDGNVAFGLNRERVKNPSELLQNPASAEALDEIEKLYEPDVMIFDTAPMMVSDDSQGLLQMVDCALLVVAAERTPMERIDVTERQLSELTNVMGIVLNRCRYTGGAHGYENEYY